MKTIIEEYGIANDFCYSVDFRILYEEKRIEYTIAPDEKWKERKIYMTVPKRNETVHTVYQTDSIQVQKNYEPLNMWLKDEAGLAALPSDAVSVVVLHPGYLDYYVLKEGDHGPAAWNFLTTRPLEVHALCSPELHAWLNEHDVELMNFRDALYGTRDYQNHLRVINNDLYRVI